MQNHVKTLFNSLQIQLYSSLQSNRAALTNSVAKGDATEDEWLNLLKNHLPYRYQADKAFVIDSAGAQSDQIDVVIYDRQYTPLLFNRNQEKFVPAESVYAVFEVKQELNLEHVRYTGRKIGSVRNLKRTSTQIINVGKDVPARSITPILGGILTSESSWNPPFGKIFDKAMP